MQKKKRHLYPIHLSVPGQILHGGRAFSVIVGNITAAGAVLETQALTIPNGMPIELAISVGRETRHISGVVSHTTPHEMGIVFNSLQQSLIEEIELITQPPRFARRSLPTSASSRF